MNTESNRIACQKYYKKNKQRSYERTIKNQQRVAKEAPWRTSLASTKARARKEGLLYTLNKEWALSKFTGACEITGINFDHQKSIYRCSIDRVNPSLGYTQENCKFILFGINMMKSNSVGYDDCKFIASKLINPDIKVTSPKTPLHNLVNSI